jgi:hypothetical protein
LERSTGTQGWLGGTGPGSDAIELYLIEGHGSRYVTRRHSTSHRAADMPPYMLDVVSATLHIAL